MACFCVTFSCIVFVQVTTQPSKIEWHIPKSWYININYFLNPCILNLSSTISVLCLISHLDLWAVNLRRLHVHQRL